MLARLTTHRDTVTDWHTDTWTHTDRQPNRQTSICREREKTETDINRQVDSQMLEMCRKAGRQAGSVRIFSGSVLHGARFLVRVEGVYTARGLVDVGGDC